MHIQTVNIHLGHSGLSAALLRAFAASFAPPDDTSASEPTKTPTALLTPPAIGKYWQGQGGVFAGIGRGQDGKRDHCLIVPTDPRAMFDKRMLGTYGIDVPNANSYHDGPTNTQALADAGSDLCKEILGLEIEGHKDYYLMSRTDAWLCMANVPELFEKEWHLTSTQYSSDYAWLQGFGGGYTLSSSKKFEARARACRRLIL